MENKTTHTPGPWKFNPESIGPMPVWADCENSAGREVRQVVATVGATYNHIDVTLYGEQNKREVSDARLIAAAPDLLAAAKEVLDTLNDGPADRECPFTSRPKMMCDCVGHRMLKNAITKAEGR